MMGMTGVGKSTFIQHFTTQEVIIGRTLESCKAKILNGARCPVCPDRVCHRYGERGYF